jgi:hypothetical protein
MQGRLAIGPAVLLALAAPAGCDPGQPDHREPFAGAYAPRGAPGQRVVHLWYADGRAPPTSDPLCADHAPPPAYACRFADSASACVAAVQDYLGRWYEDFDVHFTLVAPGDDVPHDTIIVTSKGDWCGYVPAGLAPVTCEPIEGGTAWAFSCGDSAEQCAAIIAQEHAHLLGLEHTRSSSDLMSNPLCTACTGFEDRENRVIGGQCRTLQNSYALMKQRLGPRTPAGSTPP